MMKKEFEVLIHAQEGSLKKEIWDMVEAVYLDHPAINNVGGKEQVANIFLMPGGMEILGDMYQRVLAIRRSETQYKEVLGELQHQYSLRAAEIEAVNKKYADIIGKLETGRENIKHDINELKGRK